MVANVITTKELDTAGASKGALKVGLRWSDINDLDLHVFPPNGGRIWYRARKSSCGGELDLDENAGGRRVTPALEHVFWPSSGAPSGMYDVVVDLFSYRPAEGGKSPCAFSVFIYQGDQVCCCYFHTTISVKSVKTRFAGDQNSQRSSDREKRHQEDIT